MQDFMLAMTGTIAMGMVAQQSARLNQAFNALEEVLTQKMYVKKSAEMECYLKTKHISVMMATSWIRMDAHPSARLN
jgi:hypothetical protein